MRANYLKHKVKVATQHGTQRHAYPNFERLRELILDGAIGELKTVHGWDSRQFRGPAIPPAKACRRRRCTTSSGSVRRPTIPTARSTSAARAGMNCLFWNMYRDFGVGQMGDMGAHTMDLLWNAIDAGAPTAIEVDQEVSDKYNPDICPGEAEGRASSIPANQWRGPVTVVWYQGGLKPDAPRGLHRRRPRLPTAPSSKAPRDRIIADFTTAPDHPQQRRRRLHLLQAPRAGATAAAGRGNGPAHPERRRGRRPQRPRPQPSHCRAGFTAEPNAQADRQRVRRRSSSLEKDSRRLSACRIPTSTAMLEAREERDDADREPTSFQMEWIERLQGQVQRRDPRHQQQDALRLRLLRHR